MVAQRSCRARRALSIRAHVKALQYRSTTPPAHGLVREHSRHARHDDIQRSANVDWHRRRSVRARRNTSADDSHDSVQADRDAVAGAAVGRGEDFRSIGVESAVVDVLFVFGLVTR